MDFLSVTVGFLIGTATGAAGTYYGNKFTEKRQIKQKLSKEKSLYKKLWLDHPKLLEEMKIDANNPDFIHHRNFWLLKSTWSFNHDGPFLSYHFDDHNDLQQQIQILESHGLITDVSEPGKSVQKYRFEEHFFEHLRNK